MSKETLNKSKRILFALIATLSLCALVIYAVINWPRFFYERDHWPSDIVKQCNGDFENCIVRADAVTDFEWDYIYIFEDAASNNQVQEVLGFKYNNEKALYNRKIIFVKDEEVIYEEFSFFDFTAIEPDRKEYFRYEQGPHPDYIVSERKKALFRIGLDRDSYYAFELIKED